MKKLSPDEAFYENLTLGLGSVLNSVPRVSNIICEKREPCQKTQVMTWEQRHGVYLPEDMKKFYLSTDGLLLHWSYQYGVNDTRRVGYINIPHLVQITLLRENVESNVQHTANVASGVPIATCISDSSKRSSSDTSFSTNSSATIVSVSTSMSCTTVAANPSKDQWGHPLPIIGPKTKIFEFNTVNDVAKVCLIYDTTGSNTLKIYMLELNGQKWVFLADNFSEYLRMAIAHLGLPYWELCFSSCGLPSWTEQLFLLLAPHLLEEREERRARIVDPAPERPYNSLDANIFRFKFKATNNKNVNVKR
uniref:Knr4/Smi1-like domain-containing protein n=1 Tax=Glossina morsitans morsitans TaxID=37546 RepID=A0A1B0G916_GLOMM